MNSPALRKLLLVHVGGNAVLLWLAYDWLSIGESTSLRLAVSALYALVLLTLFCWLHGATFIFFSQPSDGRKFGEAFRAALRRLAPLVLAAVVVLALYGGIYWLEASVKLKKPALFHAAMIVVRWIVVPLLTIPIFATLAARIPLAFRRSWRYWIAVPVLLAVGVILPLLILDWIPHVGSFSMELVSFAVRALIAYTLYVGSLVALSAAGSRWGKPVAA